MNRLVSGLILFSGIKNDPAVKAICNVSEIINASSFEDEAQQKQYLTEQFSEGIRILSAAAETYGLNGNIWQQYLTMLFLNDENPLTKKAERNAVKKSETIRELAIHDCGILKQLFEFDFSGMEQLLEFPYFKKIKKYKTAGLAPDALLAEKGRQIREICNAIAEAENEKAVLEALLSFYRAHGAGMYGFHTAFRIREHAADEKIEIVPVAHDPSVSLDQLVGLEIQKRQLKANTTAFCKGKTANDVLLYGDNGTGKSTSIKAILNEYADMGLRLIEVNKYQFRCLPELISMIEPRNYKFIIFIDDLSFEEDEIEYKFLKSVIEGGIENRPSNIRIYATSNRRHLIKEMWDDRKDMEYNGEIHHSDTIEEKISLSSRFGVTINFSRPDKKGYEDIVLELAKREGLKIDEKTLLAEADRWELRHGGFTGRVARQFINHMAGLED